MTGSELLMLVGGLVSTSLLALRIAFCRIARHTRRLIERHGWRDGWL